MEFELDGSPAGYDHRQPYLERFIHGAVYEARPDINAVVHSHAEDVLPFGIAPTPLRPVIQSGGFLGQSAPVWDIADNFGVTNLLVVNMVQESDLADCLDQDRVVLMRDHVFAVSAEGLAKVLPSCSSTVLKAREFLVQEGYLKLVELGKARQNTDGRLISSSNLYRFAPMRKI